jgi:hypothetical protein
LSIKLQAHREIQARVILKKCLKSKVVKNIMI